MVVDGIQEVEGSTPFSSTFQAVDSSMAFELPERVGLASALILTAS